MADLAARLTKLLADKNSKSNLVFSPLSIYAVLALLAAGAGGTTLEEVLRVLGARSRRELEDSVARLRDGPLRDTSAFDGPRVAFAYGAWSDLTRPMKPAYRDAVIGTYKAEASVVDFLNNPEQAAGQINAWAAEATRNLIMSAVFPGSLHPDTKLVLANAIYFKGNWKVPFYESHTENRPFHRLDGTAIDVPFMTSYSDSHYIAEHEGFKVLKLCYKNSPYTNTVYHHCMCIFLPDARDGLGSLLDKVTSSPGFLREHLPESRVKVGNLRVPKFELSFQSSVTDVLKDLGLRLPFTPEADLSEMLEDDSTSLPLHVQDVFQNAVVEVNEEGTDTASHTQIAGTKKCRQRHQKCRQRFFKAHKKKCCVYSSRGRSLPAFLEKCR
ncbi:putative serpin-Z8 [Lolium perenne]|uniref:putative serpin-Z8 n=1 Tax=Lolium perenne TaxID=4522 RepID=UPI0021F65C60|nr:putative serpin-Z8 [Lolium perenne]